MSSDDAPVAKFAVSQAVKLIQDQQAHGGQYGNGTQTPLTMTHQSPNILIVEKRTLVSPDRLSISPADAPPSAKYWTYRLQSTLPDTYISYKPGTVIDWSKGRVKHTNVTKHEGTTMLETSLISAGTIVFLLQPFEYQVKAKSITLEPGTAVQIAAEATTFTGGLSGRVSTDKAYYTIRTVIPEERHYIWRSHYAVHEAQLTAA